MWKPRRYRAESVGWGEGIVPPQGHAASNVGADDSDEYYAAMLYLPDPESRTGWQCHGVERKREQAPTRALGFGREG
jgi:hypothetical protein